MSAALLAILLLVPCEAPRPAARGHFAKVDLIVINRHRQVSEWTEENWRHEPVTRRKFTETWWVSFWDVLVISSPGIGPVYVDLIDRGWWSEDRVERIAPSSEGVVIESKPRNGRPGLTIIGKTLWIVDSPFDWEVRNRRLYRPLNNP